MSSAVVTMLRCVTQGAPENMRVLVNEFTVVPDTFQTEPRFGPLKMYRRFCHGWAKPITRSPSSSSKMSVPVSVPVKSVMFPAAEYQIWDGLAAYPQTHKRRR